MGSKSDLSEMICKQAEVEDVVDERKWQKAESENIHFHLKRLATATAQSKCIKK